MWSRNHRRRELTGLWVTAAALAAFTLTIHWPATRNVLVNWDDDVYWHQARHMRAFTALTPFYYHPLTWLSHAIDFQLCGAHVAGHHATNVLIHSANTALVVLLVWTVLGATGRFSFGARLASAAGVGFVFGIHPLQVESVAWLAERKTLLCGFFSLAALCAHLRSRRWLTTVLFLASLLSKPMAVPLPVVMLALDFYPLRRHVTLGWRRLILDKLPLFAASAALTAATVIGQSRWGAIAGLEELTASQRCLVAARGIGLYVQKLVWPSWLSPYFPMWENFSFADIKFLVSLVLVVGVTFVAVWQRNRAPALPAAWVSFLAMIAPVCGLFQVGAQAIADRFMYLAMLPLVLLAAAGIAWCWGRIRRVPRLAVVLFLGCYFTYFAVRTEQQIVVWRDEETLWTTVLTHFPLSGIANFHLAMALVDQHRFEEALPHAAHAVRMIGYNPLAHSTLGLVYLKTHHYAEAVAELQEALRMEPEFLASRYNLACAYARLGQIEASLATLRDLLVRQPSYAALAARENTLSALWTNTVSAARFSEMLK